jgi:hypothetical protein
VIERIRRLRRGSWRSGKTVLRTTCGLELRRYELARKWRLNRSPLPFSRTTLCLLSRPRPLVVDAAPIRCYKQLKVHDSIRLFAPRYDFRFTVFLSRFERNLEVRYLPLRSNALRRPTTREMSTATPGAMPLYVRLGSSGTSAAAAPSRADAIAGARLRENVRLQHVFSHGSGRGAQVDVVERMSFRPLAVVHSRSMVISQSRIPMLPAIRQPRQPNQPMRTDWPIPGLVTTTLPGTLARLTKHSTAMAAPRQEAAAEHFFREVKSFSVSHRRSVARKILREKMPPPSIYTASTYAPINIELVSRQVSARSSSAPAIDSLERTLVARQGSRPEDKSRRETEEKAINEKIHQQVERSVREQVERTFRTDPVLVQRLSREIHSELYRGIVVERERLGLR